MKSVITWQQALSMLGMLRFDLGQSSQSIKEMFLMGYILEYNRKMNFYYWTYSSWDCNMMNYL